MGTNRVLKRGLDVGVNQELHARGDSVARAPHRRKVVRRSGLIEEVRRGLYAIVSQDSHHPGQHEIVGLQEAAVELRRRSTYQASADVVDNQVVVVPVHVQAEQIEGAIVKAEVATDPVKGLASRQCA